MGHLKRACACPHTSTAAAPRHTPAATIWRFFGFWLLEAGLFALVPAWSAEGAVSTHLGTHSEILYCGFHYIGAFLNITTGLAEAVSLDHSFDLLVAWAASPYLIEDSPSSATEIEVSPTAPYFAPADQVVRQRPPSPPFDEEKDNMESNLMMNLGGPLPAVPVTPRAQHREVDGKRQKWSPHRLGAETLGDAFLHDRSFADVPPFPSLVPPTSTSAAPVSFARAAVDPGGASRVDPDMMSILLGIQNNTVGLNQRLDENQQLFTDKMCALEEHLVVGLKLKKDEMKEQIQGSSRILQAQMDELRRNNIEMQAKLAAAESQFELFTSEFTSRLAAVNAVEHGGDMAKLRSDIVHEVTGQLSPPFDKVAFRASMLEELKQNFVAKGCDPWAGGPSIPAPAQGRSSSSSGHANNSTHINQGFVATRVFLKGFCMFGRDKEHGLKTADSLKIGLKLLSCLPQELRAFVKTDKDAIVAPFFRNRQITIMLIPTVQAGIAYEIASSINAFVESSGLNIDGRPIYAVSDAEQWKKDRNACIAKAEAAIVNELGSLPGVTFVRDWPGSCLWATQGPTEQALGRWNRNHGWKWDPVAIHSLWPTADMGTLDMSMNI